VLDGLRHREMVAGADELSRRIGLAAEDLELTDIAGRILREPFQTSDEPYNKTVNDKLEQLYEKFGYLFPNLFLWKAHQDFLRKD
jgi:hypothetical protein